MDVSLGGRPRRPCSRRVGFSLPDLLDVKEDYGIGRLKPTLREQDRLLYALTARWLLWAIALGAYVTVQGYHSRDNDQAYRLPLLLHQQDPRLFADDPFVRALERFNPHRGYLALLDGTSRVLGLSGALFVLYAATFGATCAGFDRLARAVWPGWGMRGGIVTVGLVLLTRAGNIGTNHLFDALLLDRLLALALGWNGLAAMVENPRAGLRVTPIWLGLAAVVHPSMGLQLGLLAGATWWAWGFSRARTGVPLGMSGLASVLLALGLVPGLALAAWQRGGLLEGLPAVEFRLLSLYVQNPQHMVPHLWRWSQWLAWLAFPILAWLGFIGSREQVAVWPAARVRFALLLAVNLSGLALAWLAVEPIGSLRAAVFQPFRMATVARGFCLVVLTGRVLWLWDNGGWMGRLRVAVLAAGLTGDLALVVALGVELAATLGERHSRRGEILAGMVALVCGLAYLARHDTQSGHGPILLAVLAVALWSAIGSRRTWNLSPGRLARWAALAWTVPAAALFVPGLHTHCRFGETPVDDIERLAVWCRGHTPAEARFLGPPGPKTFRLWSRRSLAFNRAASPYDARGLADWAARFRDHVGFDGSTAEFAHAYLKDRQGLEGRYDRQNADELAALAHREGAGYIVAPALAEASDGPLVRLHQEGRYVVYALKLDMADNRPGRCAR